MALVLRDTFTAADNAGLASHSPELGSWAHWNFDSVEANADIYSNRLKNTGAANDSNNSYWRDDETHSSADYGAQIECLVVGTANGYVSAMCRALSDSKQCYLANVTRSNGRIDLYRVKNTSFVSQGSYTPGEEWAVDSVHTLLISASGTGDTVTVKVVLDGTEVISAADTHADRIVSAGHGGFWLWGGSGIEIDEAKIGPVADIEANDITAPTLSSATGSATGETTASGSVTTDEDNGTLYSVVTTSSTKPSKAQVKAGQDHTGSAAAWSDDQAISSTGAKSVSATGLSHSTAYYFHHMHEDAAENQSDVASSSSFTTDEASALTKLFVLGDSTSAAYSGQNAVSSYLDVEYDIVDLAVPGDAINNQKDDWNAYDSEARLAAAYVIIQLGLNDLEPAEAASVAIARLQTLVDDVAADTQAGCRIIVAQMTPCRSRLITLYGATNGPIAYQKWLDMNAAIAGSGANAITGVDGRITTHDDALNDGSGNLAAAYDLGDGIHENNAGRQIVAAAWEYAVEALDDAGDPVVSATSSVVSSSEVSVSVTTDAVGGKIWGVLNETATELTAAAIKSGATHSASVTVADDYALSGTGLDHNTQYYWHVTHEDGAGILGNAVTVAAKTLDLSITLDFPDTAPCSLLGYQVWSKLTVTDEEIAALWSE